MNKSALLFAITLSSIIGSPLFKTTNIFKSVNITNTNVAYDLRLFYCDSNRDGIVSSNEYNNYNLMDLVNDEADFYVAKPVDNCIYLYFYYPEDITKNLLTCTYSTSMAFSTTSSSYIENYVTGNLEFINNYSISDGYMYKYKLQDVQNTYNENTDYRFIIKNISANTIPILSDIYDEAFYRKNDSYDPIAYYFSNDVDKLDCKLGIWLSETDSYPNSFGIHFTPDYSCVKADENMICGFNFTKYDISQVVDITFSFNKYTYDYYDTKGAVTDSTGGMGGDSIYSGYIKGLGTSTLTPTDYNGDEIVLERASVKNVSKTYVSNRTVKSTKITKECTAGDYFGIIHKDSYSFNTLINTQTYDYTDQDQFKSFITNNLGGYKFAVCLGTEERSRTVIANGSSNTLGYVAYYYDIDSLCHQYEDVTFINATVRKEGEQLPFNLKLINEPLDTTFIDSTTNPAIQTTSDYWEAFLKFLKILVSILAIIIGVFLVIHILNIAGVFANLSATKKANKNNKKKK